MNEHKIRGLIAAPYTAFDSSGNLNLDIIPQYANYLKKIKVSGVFVNGTTGEGTSLTVDERLESAQQWSQCRNDHLKY